MTVTVTIIQSGEPTYSPERKAYVYHMSAEIAAIDQTYGIPIAVKETVPEDERQKTALELIRDICRLIADQAAHDADNL